MHFSFNWRTDMNNVKQPNKHYIHFLISKEHLFVFFLCDVILSSKVCFDKMALGLLSVDMPDHNLLVALWRLASPAVAVGFSLQTRNKRFSIALRILSKKNINQSNVHTCTHEALLCYAGICFSDVFLHFKNVFINHVLEVNICITWFKPIVWNCN